MGDLLTGTEVFKTTKLESWRIDMRTHQQRSQSNQPVLVKESQHPQRTLFICTKHLPP